MTKYAGVGILLAVTGLGCGGPAADDAGAEDAAALDAPRIGADASTDGAARPDAVGLDDAASPMDAPAVDPDAAMLEDAAMASDDAAASDDAFLTTDAAVLADAFVAPDAFVTPDAFVPIDAFVTPDAFAPPDAFTPRDAFVAADAPMACSTPAMGFALGIFPSGAATSGATITYVGCSATATASAGVPATWSMNVNPVASYFRLTRSGFRASNSAEINPVLFSVSANIPLQLVGTSLAPYDATRAHLLVSIGAATAPCTKAGNTVTLPGHPEATRTYINASGAALGGSTTGTDGLAWFTGIVPAAGEIATPVLTSGMGGCTHRFTTDTGRVPLIVDTVTVLNAEMRP